MCEFVGVAAGALELILSLDGVRNQARRRVMAWSSLEQARRHRGNDG